MHTWTVEQQGSVFTVHTPGLLSSKEVFLQWMFVGIMMGLQALDPHILLPAALAGTGISTYIVYSLARHKRD